MNGKERLRELLKEEYLQDEVTDYVLDNIEEGNEVVICRDNDSGLKVKSHAVRTLKIKKPVTIK